MEEKLVGLYFYDGDPEDDEEPAHYQVHALFWPKGARGGNRLWNADCTMVEPSGPDGQYVPVSGAEITVYVVNEVLYTMESERC